MKKIIMIVVAMATMMAAYANGYKYESVEGDKTGTRIYTLDNGLKVYLSVNKDKPRIQAYIAVRTGSRNDPKETTGLAHYLEHIMFKGTTNFGTTDAKTEAVYLKQIEDLYETYRSLTDSTERSLCYHKIDSISQIAAQYNIPNEYDKMMAAIGASGTNAYTSNDVTCYTENVPANELDAWAQIQADRFQNMVVRGFHTELEAVYEEYNIGLAQDNNKWWTANYALLFPNHPYGTQTTIGTQEHLKNPSIVNVKNYFNKFYVPNNVAICLCGDLDPDSTIALINKHFGAWKPNPNLTFTQYPRLKERTEVSDTTVVGQESEMISVSWPFDGAASMQNDTLSLVAKMLSNGNAGIMDLNINQKMKTLYSAAFLASNNEYSSLILYGMPNEGQSLDDVKAVMLQEIENLKKGNFADDLLQSVYNNEKLADMITMEYASQRVDKYVDAFINGAKWKDVVEKSERMGRITRDDIIAFAKRHFKENYVVVYKRTGEDNSIKKIDKPKITAIPSNRDHQSNFATRIIEHKAQDLTPQFVDFNKDLTQGKTKKGLPVLYVKNNENGRFSLTYVYDLGQENNKWLTYAAEYLSLLGTDKMTAEEFKQKMYKLACSFNVSTGIANMYVEISGLADNMKEAIILAEDFMANAKADKEAWNKYTEQVMKSRKDNKLDQSTNFNVLSQYGIYGDYNEQKNIPDSTELVNCNPEDMVALINGIAKYKHHIQYYGPENIKQLTAIINKYHKTPKTLLDAPKGRQYQEQIVNETEIFIAPYNAKNIYMSQYTNTGRKWNADNTAVISVFNEYFGGSMNSVVFQELRESRALAYSASGYYITPWRKNHPEYSRTYIISQNDKMMDCIYTFNSIIDTVPQSEKAFNLAVQSIKKSIESRRVTKEGIISAYESAKKKGIDYDIYKKVYEALPSMTLADIVKFEQETMAGKPRRYLILGNEDELDMEALGKIGKIHRLTTEQIFGY